MLEPFAALPQVARSLNLQTRVVSVSREGFAVLTRVFGGGGADALPARGALGASLRRLRDTGALEFHAGLRRMLQARWSPASPAPWDGRSSALLEDS